MLAIEQRGGFVRRRWQRNARGAHGTFVAVNVAVDCRTDLSEGAPSEGSRRTRRHKAKGPGAGGRLRHSGASCRIEHRNQGSRARQAADRWTAQRGLRRPVPGRFTLSVVCAMATPRAVSHPHTSSRPSRKGGRRGDGAPAVLAV
jgi:hypothetical protein